MAFVEEPGQDMTPGKQNVQAKAPALVTEVSPPNQEQSEGENENERLLLFSDGIIAFTITLATISMKNHVETGTQSAHFRRASCVDPCLVNTDRYSDLLLDLPAGGICRIRNTPYQAFLRAL